MKLSEITRISESLSQVISEYLSQSDRSADDRLTTREMQQLFCASGISSGNLYQELEMDSDYVDVHEDISTSRDEVQLHSHTFYEVLYCRSGNLEYLLGTDRYRLQRGDIAIIPPGVSHRPLFLEQLTEPYNRVVFWINGDYAETILQRFSAPQVDRHPQLLRTA